MGKVLEAVWVFCRTHRLKVTVIVLMAVFIGSLGQIQPPVFAQDQDETSVSASKAAIVLDGRELFTVGGLPRFTAAERADFANHVLQDQVQRFPLDAPILVSPLERGDLRRLNDVEGGRGAFSHPDQPGPDRGNYR